MSGFWIAATTGFALLSCEDARAEELPQELKAQRYIPLPLVRADAVWAARKLKAVLGTDADIVADEETNTVFVRASAGTIERAKDILKRLDEPFHRRVIEVKHRRGRNGKDARVAAKSVGSVAG